MTNKEAYLILSLLPSIGPISGFRLLQSVDSSSNIFKLTRKYLLQRTYLNQKQVENILNWKEFVDLKKEKRILEKSRTHFITLDDSCYPQGLKEIYNPPICLYAQGNLELLTSSNYNFAVVGSRRSTRYGRSITEKLVASAINCQWVIVSGLALGIDTIAHQEALQNVHGKTIAVLGSGLGCIYPKDNIELARDIVAKEGLLLSEFHLLKRPDKSTFPMRNRLISGISMGVLVVEASINSGALITANFALDQGKQVFAVPGNIDKSSSQGCHKLIKDGAALVTCFEDIISEYDNLNLEGVQKIGNNEKIQYNVHLSDLEEKVIKIIALEEEVLFDDMFTQIKEEPSSLFVALMKLETKKMIKSLPGKRYTLSDYIKEKL